MPFWKEYVHTKPEVDDDDLPLPEHRIFDDDGYLKEKVEKAVASVLRTSSSHPINAKKSSTLSPKRRAELLKSVGAKLTSPLKVADVTTKTPAAAAAAAAPVARSRASSRSRSPSARKSSTRSPAATPKAASTPRRASSAHKSTPKKASPKVAAKKATPSRPPARKRAVSPSPAKPKASPRAAAARSKRSRSKSGSRKEAKAAHSKTPSPKWTLQALRDFAKEKSIALEGATKKADILKAIKKSA
jgi:hypothetical protein